VGMEQPVNSYAGLMITFYSMMLLSNIVKLDPGGPSLLEISSMITGNVEIYFRNLEIYSEIWK